MKKTFHLKSVNRGIVLFKINLPEHKRKSNYMYKFSQNVILRLFCLILVLSFAVSGDASGDVHGRPELNKKRIIVGGSNDYPPYSYIDENGEPAGFSVDMSRAVAGVLNRDIVFHLEPWHKALVSLKNKDTDLIHDIVYSEERRKTFSFSAFYYISPYAVFAKKSSPELNSFEDLAGKRIVLVRGDIGHDYIIERNIVAYIHVVESYADAIMLLENGDFQYTLTDQLAGQYWIKTIGAKNVKYTGVSPFRIRYSFAEPAEDERLTLEVSGALSIIRASGEYQAIYNKWMNRTDPAFMSMGDFIRKYSWLFYSAAASLLFLFLWNFTLQRKVAQRTKDLETSNKIIAEREEMIRSISNNIQSGIIFQIIVTDEGLQKFTYLSDPVKVLYGISPEEAMEDAGLIFDKIHEDDTGSLIKGLRGSAGSLTPFKAEYRVLSPSGTLRRAMAAAIPRRCRKGEICFDGIEFDISELKESEEKVKTLLGEKELLLREVHHRIKNNMNTIRGLLTLQVAAERNPDAAASLRDAESRIQSMIMLYDRLDRTENFREMSIKEYLEPLIREIVGSFNNSGMVTIKTDIDDFILDVQNLSPIGIIVNELITNIMKYAFPGNNSGTIWVSASHIRGVVSLHIRDNGAGIPDSIDFKKSTGFGLDLVAMLTEQIGGSIRIERGNGTGFLIEFVP